MTEKAIVLVEPDVSVHAYIAKGLNGLHYKIHFFESAKSVVNWDGWGSCVLLITSDWSPNYSGIELVESLRLRNYAFPIIMTTSMFESHQRHVLLAKGVSQVIEKPFRAEDLFVAVREMLLNKYPDSL